MHYIYFQNLKSKKSWVHFFLTPTKPKRFVVKKKKKTKPKRFWRNPICFCILHTPTPPPQCVRQHNNINNKARAENTIQISLSLELISVPRERLRENERRLRGLTFSIRRRSLHSRLDLLQSPLLSLSFSIFHFN